MKHTQWKEWLILSLYEELNEQEQALLDHHLTACGSCRKDFQELKKFHGMVSHRHETEEGGESLADARRSLRLRLFAESENGSLFKKWKTALDRYTNPAFQWALGASAMILVGIGVGYYAFQPADEKPLNAFRQAGGLEAGESQIINVRFLDRDIRTGDVEFAFESVTPVRVRGNINDAHVQKVLARALVSDENAGVRLRAVNMIGARSAQNPKAVSSSSAEVKSALISALLHDRNLGVRKEALTALRHYLPDQEVVRAFLNVLANEKNTGLKIAAINSLDLAQYENQPMNQEILDMLRQKAQSDDNNYIRIKARTALQEVQQ